MSLHPEPIGAIPEQTARVAHAAFPAGNPYVRMRDELESLIEDRDLAHLFPRRGQPAERPWRLALITIFQFAEDLSDRQAADAVRARIDWKYALGLELDNPGFDHTVLSEFPRPPGRWRCRAVALRSHPRPLSSAGPAQRPWAAAHRLQPCPGRSSGPQSPGVGA